jgi:hypothetical protein
MSGAIPPLPQYTFMAWYLVKAQEPYFICRSHVLTIECAYHGNGKVLSESCKESGRRKQGHIW